MKLLSELDSLDNVKDGNTRKIPTKTSDLTNDSGFITSIGDYVDLTTAQTIEGVKTFSDDLKLSKKLYVGTMQTIYNAGAESGFMGSLFIGNGGSSLSHTTGDSGYCNIGIGNYSLYGNTTGSYNIGIGDASLNYNTTGSYNIGIGSRSLYGNTGSYNTGIGNYSLNYNTTGSYNTGIGSRSLYGNTTGSYNTGIGYVAGRYISNGSTANATPNNSVYIGAKTKALADNQRNQIVIGYETTGHGSNTATIGNTDITDNYFNGNLHLTGTIKDATNTFTLPTATGTLALTSQIPSVSSFLTASNIKAGTNISLSVSGNDVTINSTAGGGGTVTSVGITAGSGISVSNSPITTSGNITVNNTGVLSVNGGAGAITGIATTTQLATKAVQPYIQKSYAGGNGARLIGTYNYSTSVGDTRPLFYLAGKQGHGNGTSYLWQGEFIFGVATTGAVTAKAILTVSDGTFGKFYYRHDTVNKILYLYIYTGQYSSAYFSDLVQINAGDYSSYFTLASAGSVTTDTIVEGVNLLYPATSGTMALTSQIPTNSTYVDLTSTQTISGAKTFSDDLKLSKKLYVGTMQTIYNAEAEGGFTGSLFFGNGGASLSHAAGFEGYGNTGVGNNSLFANTAGFDNTGVGNNSLFANTTGSFNTGVGFGSFQSNTIGYNNTGVGFGSFQNNTIGNNNTGVGNNSLFANITGSFNTGVGSKAGRYISNGYTENTTPNNSVYIGANTKALADNQTNEIVIGYNATGHGSNTVTIGHTSITDNYFNGNIHSTAGTLVIENATQTLSNKTLASPNITTALNLNGHAIGTAGGLESIVSVSNGSTSTYIKNANGTIFQSGVIDHGSNAYDWTANITFTGFTNTPRIFACPLEASGSGCMAYVYRTPTNTGATIRQTSKYGAGGSARYVYWFAIGN